MRAFRAVAVFSLGVLAFGCATARNGERGGEALLEVDRAWAAAASEGKDLERILSFWSDDATVFPPGSPVVQGKPALRSFVQQSLSTPGFHISWRSDKASVSADGTMGFTTGTNALTVPGPDGKVITIAGRSVSVWRRLPGGEWKCVIDIWNAGP